MMVLLLATAILCMAINMANADVVVFVVRYIISSVSISGIFSKKYPGNPDDSVLMY